MTDSTPSKDQRGEDSTISLTEATMEAPSDTTITPETPILQNAHVSLRSTYASMVGLDEASEFKFMPSSLINGLKYAKVDFDDVKDEINYWQQAVLCFVLGANPPFAVVQGFIQKKWFAYELD